MGTRKSPMVRPRSWAGRRSMRGMPIVIPDLRLGPLATLVPRRAESSRADRRSVEAERLDDRDARGSARRRERRERRQDEPENRCDSDRQPRDPARVSEAAAELEQDGAYRDPRRGAEGHADDAEDRGL